jgi:uncharacterized protein (UPF0335 family)
MDFVGPDHECYLKYSESDKSDLYQNITKFERLEDENAELKNKIC